MILKSYVDQLRKGLFETNDLLGRVLSKDVEYVQNLEASLMSCLEPSEALNVVGLPLGSPDNVISLNKENKVLLLLLFLFFFFFVTLISAFFSVSVTGNCLFMYISQRLQK